MNRGLLINISKLRHIYALRLISSIPVPVKLLVNADHPISLKLQLWLVLPSAEKIQWAMRMGVSRSFSVAVAVDQLRKGCQSQKSGKGKNEE